MRRPGFLALGLLMVSACHAEKPRVTIADFYGEWKVVKINNIDDITTSAAYRQALVGTTIRITPDAVSETGEDDCPIDRKTDHVSMVDSASEMRASEGVSPASVGLPPRVAKFELGCMDFYKVGNHLVFGDRGAWYSAERIR